MHAFGQKIMLCYYRYHLHKSYTTSAGCCLNMGFMVGAWLPSQNTEFFICNHVIVKWTKNLERRCHSIFCRGYVKKTWNDSVDTEARTKEIKYLTTVSSLSLWIKLYRNCDRQGLATQVRLEVNENSEELHGMKGGFRRRSQTFPNLSKWSTKRSYGTSGVSIYRKDVRLLGVYPSRADLPFLPCPPLPVFSTSLFSGLRCDTLVWHVFFSYVLLS